MMEKNEKSDDEKNGKKGRWKKKNKMKWKKNKLKFKSRQYKLEVWRLN
jgi:hypothetical protein